MLVETLLARMERSSSSQLRKLLHRTIVVICKHSDQTKLDESERIMVGTNNIVSHNLKDQPNDIAIYQEDNTEVLERAIAEKGRRDVEMTQNERENADKKEEKTAERNDPDLYGKHSNECFSLNLFKPFSFFYLLSSFLNFLFFNLRTHLQKAFSAIPKIRGEYYKLLFHLY